MSKRLTFIGISYKSKSSFDIDKGFEKKFNVFVDQVVDHSLASMYL